ncbi:hypothetical protein EVAR_75787_1 [Eumeta japonica]|uniref:Uncharacterized protein n=1 Tax=Eumeta variegata TaxID=151549 RepID=A0A4C1TDY8_EUMVA|nr:hypothetical protein EVAR_75787_1 [Eumeta japonica]
MGFNISLIPVDINGVSERDGVDAAAAVDASRDEDAPHLRCGWGSARPNWLQRFRTAKWALFWLCWAGALQVTPPGMTFLGRVAMMKYNSPNETRRARHLILEVMPLPFRDVRRPMHIFLRYTAR